MDQQPKIPTLKDAQKPQVKVKGLGAGLTLFDRLKQFKKKDLAFILAGLGTLFMAPLAEHFMMAPENGSSDLQSGFRGSSSGGGIFGSGSSPYESGNNSIAQGGAIGGSGDIITPLNVRDPSALVMGPGSSQQPPAGSVAPATPPPSAPASSASDYKDALAGAASRAASAAVKKSPLPVPKVALGGSGLRGLGVAGGGSSASGGLGPIAGGGGGTAGTGGGGLNLVRPTPGFRSAAGARGPGNPTGLDGTKKAGQNAGDAFSRTGSALSGLNAAAAEQIPTGGQGFNGGGQGGAGANDKGPGGNGPGGSKSVGESLAFIEAKERMMENLKLEFEKRKLKDPELLLYGIRNDSLKAMASEMTKSLTKGILSFMDPSSAAANEGSLSCPPLNPGPVPFGTAKKCSTEANAPKIACFECSGTACVYYATPTSNQACTFTGKAGSSESNTQGAASTPTDGVFGAPTGDGRAATESLDGFCRSLKTVMTELKKRPSDATAVRRLAAMEVTYAEVGELVANRDALYSKANTDSCEGYKAIRDKSSVLEFQTVVVDSLLDATDGVPGLQKLAGQDKGSVKTDKIDAAEKALKDAKDLMTKLRLGTAKVTLSPEYTRTEFEEPTKKAQAALEYLRGTTAPEMSKSLDRLAPLLEGAQYAAKIEPLTVPKVIEGNKGYMEMAKTAEAKSIKPGDGATAPSENPPAANAPKDPKSLAQGVARAVTELKPLVDDAKAKIAAIDTAVDEAAKTKAKEDAKTAVDKAYFGWGGMQKKQTDVLSGISGELNKYKSAPATPGASTPRVGL